MEQLCKFSFIDWIESVYPSEDDTNAKEEIYKFFSDSLQNNAAWPVLKESFKTNLDMFTVLCKSDTESVDVEAISLLCESMEKIKYTCIETKVQDDYMTIYNGYNLNLSALPTAVLFWKHILDNNGVPNTKRMTRANFENEYKIYTGRNNNTIKFSHILFCLSWLNILRVVNNSTIIFNNKCNLIFY